MVKSLKTVCQFWPGFVARLEEMSSPVALPFSGRPSADPPRSIKQRNLLSPSGIRAQLWKILNSQGFAHARRMRCFLEFVVEEALAGRANQLCEYAVAISVFERDESFSPGLDPIVRNDARRLRQKLVEYYYRSQGDDQIVIDIPKGGYAPVFRPVSEARAARGHENYRLVASLIRLEDGAEVWNTEQTFWLNEKPLDPGFHITFGKGTPAIKTNKQLRLLS
jgi:hypothetical protein